MLRFRASSADALPQLSLVAVVVGLLAAGTIVLFRLAIESAQASFLPGHQPENYEGLDWPMRLFLPAVGGLAVGFLLERTATAPSVGGVVHVMERFALHQGRIPWRPALLQFIGAALCIISGESVGREGPSVHLGAASGSLLGRQLGLPNNSVQILVACGVAAAIATSFNTPLAGVVFAIEVIVMEYTVIGFIPVIVASVVGAVVSRAIFGSEPAFPVPPVAMRSLLDLPYLLILGLVLGALAACFTQSLVLFSRLGRNASLWGRATVGGILVGICALPAPSIMGIGYDTVHGILLGQIDLKTMIIIVALKTLATTAGLGLGLPGGLIGPTLFIGAATGGAMGILGQLAAPHVASDASFYAMVGLAGMMGATLQAPLAALTALLELTDNPHILMPAMLTVVSSNLVAREVFRKESVFVTLMRARGLEVLNGPVAKRLHRIGVATLADRRFVVLPALLTRKAIISALRTIPRWILITHDATLGWVMPATDLVSALANDRRTQFNLFDIPAHRSAICPVPFHATLHGALELLNTAQIDMLYVADPAVSGKPRIYGVVRRQDILSTVSRAHADIRGSDVSHRRVA